ncbi:hypothetical protein EW145_g1618 [Phellinidium pouzarii]|uniref:Uncharacterized protein n=1 Tax=Phellinidium pouzarii TaxID=167371 RepID=A0A4S4LDS0_9AGAM|nr:hypothetical protein EW145_g1618 [Phellinidium pouzarii]
MPSSLKSATKTFFKKSTHSSGSGSGSGSENESYTTHSSSVNDVQRRRAEALQACGLLQQSRIYGRAPYRDKDDGSEGSYGAGPADERNLIEFDADYERKDERESKYGVEQIPLSEETYSPRPSSRYSPPAPMYSPTPSDCSAAFSDRQARPQHIKMRRMASLVSDVERIEDAESRHLTKVAFLY